MKKIIFFFIIFSLLSLMASRGFQLLYPNSIHFMHGNLAASHEMPENQCDAQSCVMATKAVLIMAALFSGISEQQSLKMIAFLSLISVTFLLALEQNRRARSREHPDFFQTVPVAVTTVVFRE